MATGCSGALDDVSSEKVDEVFINNTDRARSEPLNVANPMTSAFVILLWRFCLAWPGLLVPDAGSYAPVTILIDERSDGVRISYDRMTRFLAPYGNAEALEVARDLDCKVEALLNSVA